jgi:heme oxygenase
VTCERILEKVSNGGYSTEFVKELTLFHAELQDFFNATELDKQLEKFLNSSTVTESMKKLARKKIQLIVNI